MTGKELYGLARLKEVAGNENLKKYKDIIESLFEKINNKDWDEGFNEDGGLVPRIPFSSERKFIGYKIDKITRGWFLSVISDIKNNMRERSHLEWEMKWRLNPIIETITDYEVNEDIYSIHSRLNFWHHIENKEKSDNGRRKT